MIRLYRRVQAAIRRYVHSDDPMAALANSGAIIVWTHLPFYPLLVLWFAGRPIWPALTLYVSLPFFVAVGPLSTRHPVAARILFPLAGLANTVIALVAFGVASGAGWFLVPSLIIAALFFRFDEWRISAGLTLACALVALSFRHLGPPLHTYTASQYRHLFSLNLWCVAGLSLWLLAVIAHRQWRQARSGG